MTNIDTMKPIIASAISNPAGTCGHGCEGFPLTKEEKEYA